MGHNETISRSVMQLGRRVSAESLSPTIPDHFSIAETNSSCFWPTTLWRQTDTLIKVWKGDSVWKHPNNNSLKLVILYNKVPLVNNLTLTMSCTFVILVNGKNTTVRVSSCPLNNIKSVRLSLSKINKWVVFIVSSCSLITKVNKWNFIVVLVSLIWTAAKNRYKNTNKVHKYIRAY